MSRSDIRFNSLTPGECGNDLKIATFKPVLWFDILWTSCKIAVGWMPQNPFDYKSTLVLVMAWYHHAASHYLNQCWSTSLIPCGITRPQWVKYKFIFLKNNSTHYVLNLHSCFSCHGGRYTARWYHISPGEHYCNSCFEHVYRRWEEGFVKFEEMFSRRFEN